MIVFCVYKVYPLLGPSHLVEIFDTREKAETFANYELGKLPNNSKPINDDYGLSDGIDFIVEPWEVK